MKVMIREARKTWIVKILIEKIIHKMNIQKMKNTETKMMNRMEMTLMKIKEEERGTIHMAQKKITNSAKKIPKMETLS